MKKPGIPARQVLHTRIKDPEQLEAEWEIGEELGNGAFGIVKKCVNKADGKLWAVKIVDKGKAGSTGIRQMEKEVSILKTVNHPHIVQIKQVYETPKQTFMIMEICDGGELHDILAERKRFNEADAKIVIKRLSEACAYLHQNDIVHRDLKLENLLFCTEGTGDEYNVKITDFGLSTTLGESQMNDVCGTPLYMAPEIINNLGYNIGCDIWALGIITHYLLCGQPPFVDKKEEDLYDKIRSGDISFSEPIWSTISESAKNLIRGMLKVDPAMRFTAKEILDHPWITGDDAMTGPMPTVLEMMKMFAAERRFKRAYWAICAANRFINLGMNDANGNPMRITHDISEERKRGEGYPCTLAGYLEEEAAAAAAQQKAQEEEENGDAARPGSGSKRKVRTSKVGGVSAKSSTASTVSKMSVASSSRQKKLSTREAMTRSSKGGKVPALGRPGSGGGERPLKEWKEPTKPANTKLPKI